MGKDAESTWKPGGRGRPPKWFKAGLSAPPAAARADAPAGHPAPAGPGSAPARSEGTGKASARASGPPGQREPLKNPLRAGAAPGGGASSAASPAAPQLSEAEQVKAAQEALTTLGGVIQPAVEVALDFVCDWARREHVDPDTIAEKKIPEQTVALVQAWWPGMGLDPRWLVTIVLAGSVYRLVKAQPRVGERARAGDEAPVRPAAGAAAPARPAPAPTPTPTPAAPPPPEPEPAPPDEGDEAPIPLEID